MNLGFSTLSIFMKSIDEMLTIGEKEGFQTIEILCEGPSSPWVLLENQEKLENINSHNIEINLHGPSIDLNLASINKGIRMESVKQICEAIDLAKLIGANAITVHPGQVGRREKLLRKKALELSSQSIAQCIDYKKEINSDVKISIENLPERFSFLCNRPEELVNIQEETGCTITIDTGHANTCEAPEEFFDLKHIEYFHLNDNNGEKDQHLPLGDGNLDLNLLKKVNKGIIELSNFKDVLKSKKLIENL